MSCFHCAEQLSESQRWQVEYDGQLRDVCCPGCQAVMQAIVDADLGDYYRFRTEPAQFGVIPDDVGHRLDELAVFDEPEISERYLHRAYDTVSAGDRILNDVNLSVEGMRCGACVWVLERSVKGLNGVDSVSVNFSSARATIRFDPERIRLSRILGRIAEVGYKSQPFDVRERELSLNRESRIFMQRLFIAGIATMQVMMYALPAYLSDAGDIEPEHEQLLRWASLILTTPVLLYSAQPFLKGAFKDLVNRQPGMDVPVSIGIFTAFFASVWATVTASGEIYFDSVAMFVFLLLGARYLEWSARRRAMRAVDDISASAPESAKRITAGTIETVPVARLNVDDYVAVDNGSRIPVDGEVLEGDSSISNALVTGESVPVRISTGDCVPGGALLTGAPVVIRVLRRQSASTLSIIDRLIQRGASEKPEAVMLADRIATLFVSALLVFAALVWLIWLKLDSSRAATTAIAVLVVSCPCALSLATPAALAAATGELLKQRILITRGHALEALANVTDVVFDKTGTLTNGTPSFVSVDVHGSLTRECALKLAVALEMGSTHPYAFALRRALQSEGLALADADTRTALLSLGMDALEIQHQAGRGVAAKLADGHCIYLGSSAWCHWDAAQLAPDSSIEACKTQSTSEVYLSRRMSNDGADQGVQALARFVLKDELRPGVTALVDRLRHQGKVIHLLSGDRAPAVVAVAKQLAIDNFKSGATPEDKQQYVAGLQAKKCIVLMVGDGINDAPVLASADVSMAVGEATALARNAADVISLQHGLDGLEFLLAKASNTSAIVRQNLIWAASYNTLAIPLAALGYVPPWAAAIGMAGSSLLVAANAQRLWAHDRQLTGFVRAATRGRLWNRFSY